MDVLLGLRIDRVRAFLRHYGLSLSGVKADLRDRLIEALASDAFGRDQLIDYLDAVEPWGRQHVILLEAEQSAADGWRREDGVRRRLAAAGVEQLLDARQRQSLPEALTLSSIASDNGVVEITAVERREYDERAAGHDRYETEGDGDVFLFKAYRHVVSRGLLTFRWNTATRAAALHVSEGFGRYDYEGALRRFGSLVSSFLDFNRFAQKDIRRAIGRLHEAEKAGTPEARSHRVGYTSHGGRVVEASSPTPNTSVVGERVVDEALTNVAGASTGRSGNFFWLPRSGPSRPANPLARDLHVVVLGYESRIHFRIPSDEASITYVLQRIRALS